MHNSPLGHLGVVVVVTALVAATLAPPAPALAQPAHVAPHSDELEQAHATARADGRVQVLVELPSDDVGAQTAAARPARAHRREIARLQAALTAQLPAGAYEVAHRYESIGALALSLTPAGVRALGASDLPEAVVADRRLELPTGPRPAETDDAATAPMRGLAAGAAGAGQTIAIIDTGVDTTHPMLAGQVVDEACFASEQGCPGGQSSQTGPGSASDACAHAEVCAHGTHVAGIAAGDAGGSDGQGVAAEASMLAVQVFPSDPSLYADGGRPTASSLDVLRALDWVHAQRAEHDIAAVNLSLGSGLHERACDDTDSLSRAYSAAVANLHDAGIATVAASGNGGQNVVDAGVEHLTMPACLEQVTAVGAAHADGNLASFSNVSPELTLLAPGVGIRSAASGGGYQWMSGTSMAAPAVSGALAILRQGHPSADVSELATALRATGAPVAYPRVELRRADTVAASALLERSPAPAHGFDDVAAGAYFNDAVSWLVDQRITEGTAPERYSPYEAVTRGQMAALLWRLNGRIAAPAPSFDDVVAPAYYHAAVGWLLDRGITTGRTAQRYEPGGNLTRGELASLLWRMLKQPEPSTGPSFSDVPGEAHYADAVTWLAEHDVVAGQTDGSFRPGELVTRGQMAALLHRLARRPELWRAPAAPPPSSVLAIGTPES